jgi:hypothetical protein
VLDGLVISLQGAPLGFLWAPFQAVQQTADMIPMVLNSELVVDQFRNASGSPQIRPVAVHHRALQQKLDQALSLLPIQLPGSTWGKAHPQSRSSTLPSSITPAHHRTCMTADTPSYFVKRVTRIQQCQGPLTPIFEQVGAPFQSGHRSSAPETAYYCIIYADVK